MFKGVEALVFDLDDTLYPETDFVLSGLAAVGEYIREQLGLEIFPELKERFLRGERGDLFTPTLAKYMAVDEDFIRTLVDVYRRHTPMIHLYEDAAAVLAAYSQVKKLGLITDGWLEVQKRKVKALGIEGYFDAIIYSDQFGREFWKPHPKPFEECRALLSTDFSAMIYIADNPTKDFIAPKLLGMGTIRILRKDGIYVNESMESSSGQADMTIKDLRQLYALVT